MKYFMICSCLWTVLLYSSDCQEQFNDTEPHIIRLGVILDSNNVSSTFRTIQVESVTAEITFNHIAKKEPFEIFSAVQRLPDAMDAIVISFSDPSELPALGPIMQLVPIPIIKWFQNLQTPHEEKQAVNQNISEAGDICTATSLSLETHLSVLFPGEEQCIENPDPFKTAEDFADRYVHVARIVTSLIVTKLKWKRVYIMYDHTTAEEVEETTEMLSEYMVLFSLHHVGLETRLHDVLDEAYDSETTVTGGGQINVVVLCGFECARQVLRQANIFDRISKSRKTILKQISRWLVVVKGHTSGVTAVLQSCANDLDNVAVLALPEVIDTNPQPLEFILESALLEVQLSGEILDRTTLTQLAITSFLVKAEMWNPAVSCRGFKIHTLQWTSEGRGFTTIGYVTPSADIFLDSDRTSYIFPNTKYGFNKRQLLIATLPYDPFVTKSLSNGTVIYNGLCMELLKELSSKMNFTYRFTEPIDGLWGSKYANGSWNGLVGLLEREEVDMTVAPLAWQGDRDMVMDFIYPFYYDYTTVLLKLPDPDAKKWRKLLDPFHWNVLLALALLLPFMSFLVYIMEKYNPYYDHPLHAKRREIKGGLHTFESSIWYMYGALLCQGGVHLPASVAGRTIVSTWWLFSIVIVGVYSGNLIAFLTVSKEELPFTTLEQMIEMDGDYTWGILGGTFWELVFQTSSIPTFKKVGEAMGEFKAHDQSIMSTNLTTHLDKVRQGKYVWIGDKTTMELIMAVDCDLRKIKEEFIPMKYAFGLQNNSPYVKLFSDEVMALHETGLLQVWKQQWWPKAILCYPESTTQAKPIELLDVQSAFYLVAAGLFLASLTLTIEVLVDCYRRRKRNREQDD